ncbi:DUF3883 domain-containing protein [Candidatus Poseidoniales archaeon]|nr:DUF3883 domain-containing protein [Candidatus Poseidoniales archaeon]
MLTEEIIQRILTKIMTPEKRYRVKELELLMESNYDFSSWDREIIPSEDRERWRILVKNSVRRSPMRTDFSTNSWPELKLEKTNSGYFHYFISTNNVLELVELKRPASCDWWAAEMAVMSNLTERGFTQVEYVGDQRIGCDITCQDHDGTHLFVEVKSSTQSCSPTFTENEWETAQREGTSYHLAVLENFNPEISDTAFIQYVVNPGRLEVSASNVTSFRLSRSQWSLIQ